MHGTATAQPPGSQPAPEEPTRSYRAGECRRQVSVLDHGKNGLLVVDWHATDLRLVEKLTDPRDGPDQAEAIADDYLLEAERAGRPLAEPTADTSANANAGANSNRVGGG